MFPSAAAPIVVPPPAVSEPAPTVQVPEPEPVVVEEKQEETMISRVRALVNAEVKANPTPYQNADARELDVMFRQMLIAKLTKPQAPSLSVNKSTKPVTKLVAKPATKKEKLKFKVKKVQSSEEEVDYDVSGSDSDSESEL